jgi:CBS domain-containing protein
MAPARVTGRLRIAEKDDMRVADVMQTEVVTTFGEESLADAAQRMRDHDMGALVVLDDEDGMVGVVTERDVLRAVAEGLAPRVTSVSGLMSPAPLEVTPETDSEEAARLMVEGGVRHLPVVRQGEAVGMVSARDLLLLEAWPRPGRE